MRRGARKGGQYCCDGRLRGGFHEGKRPIVDIAMSE